MAIQTVDFSTINNVTKDGVALTQVVIDGVTLWTSNYVGQTWQKKGQTLLGDLAGDDLGKSVSLSGDGSRLAVGIIDGGLDVDGAVKIYFWNGSFWALEQELVFVNTSPTTNSNFGHFVLLSDTGFDLFVIETESDNASGRIEHYQRSGTSWSLITAITGATNGDRLGYCGLSLSANNAFVWTTQGYGVYWSSSMSLGGLIDGLSGVNAAINKTDGTVVAINEYNVTRNGFSGAGEIRVYEGAIGVKPSTPKGLPITGTSLNASLGGGSSPFQEMCLDAAGDRLFATHANDVLVYDFIGGLWSLSHTITPPVSPNSIDITSDGLRLAVGATGGISVYAENGGVWDLINPSVVTTPMTNPTVVALSDDGTHFAAGDYLDDTNGSNAGAAVAYTLI